SYFIHVHCFGGYEKHKVRPTDRPSLAIVEIDRWQYTATYDDSRGRFVYPPAVFRGPTDWDVVGARDGSPFPSARPKVATPPAENSARLRRAGIHQQRGVAPEDEHPRWNPDVSAGHSGGGAEAREGRTQALGGLVRAVARIRTSKES